MTDLLTNLIFIVQKPKILLGMKKRRLGAGKWNGYGGKVLDGESMEDSLIREVEEEAGIKIKNFEKLGIMDFYMPHADLHIENHVYKTNEYEGEVIETEEMRPEWFDIDKMPFEAMWKDDPLWMPLLLEDRKFRGRFVFGENEEILEHELKEVENL
jgi:8-oxo-dGTP diphosphatase/2-hydroxy-dATP diphosphatase